MSDDPKAKADPKPGAAPTRLRPTILEIPAKRAQNQKTAAPDPGAPTHRPLTPTAIPGVARKRIGVRSADMTRLSPGAEPRTAALAVRLVDGFVVDGARDQHVAAWGLATQQRCEDLVSSALELSRADAVGPARDHVGRIVELLGTIDIDTPRGLKTARIELEQLVHLSRTALPSLLDVKAALEDHARQIDETSLEIEATALAAMFLSEHLASPRPELSRHFLQREMSLTKTAGQARAGQFERNGQVAEARALTAAIQDVVLVTLPDWLISLRQVRRGQNPTEVAELRHRLRAILRKLEP